MTQKEVSLAIGADSTPLASDMEQAKRIVRGAVGEMQSAFGRMQATFAVVQRAMVAMTAVLAGGAAFREAIGSAVDLAVESETLGRQLGIGASQASILKVALGDVYVTQEQLLAATGKITQTLNTNEGAFAKLGVATRDSNGNLRNSLDILLDVNTKLAGLKAGTDRNVAGVQIFGRSWSSVEPLLRLTVQAMEAAEEKARSLGLVIGEETSQAVQQYRAALNDANDLTAAFQMTISAALLPRLTEMSESVARNSTDAVKSFRFFVAEVETVFLGLSTAIQGIYLVIAGALRQLGRIFFSFAEIATRAMVLDFKGAEAAWQRFLSRFHANGRDWMARVTDLAEDAAADYAEIWERGLSRKIPTPTANPPGGDGGAPPGPGQSGSRGRVPIWQAALDEQKAAWQAAQRAEGSFREFSKEQEIAYWQSILQTEKFNGQEQVTVRAKIAQLMLAIDKDRFQAEIADLKAQEAAVQANGMARLEIAREIAQRMRAAYGEESQQYGAARRDVIAAEKQIQDELLQKRLIAAETARTIALIELDAEEEAMRERAELRQVSEAEALAAEQEFERRRVEIRRQALQEQRALIDPNLDPVQYAQLSAQIEEIEAQHQARMGKLRREESRATQANWQRAFASMESGFASTFAAMAKGQRSFAEGARDLMASVVDSVVGMYGQLVAQWLAGQLSQVVGAKTAGLSTITAHAAEAGAGAYAATAAIPVVGPALAPAAAQTAFAGAMAYTAALSAAKGYDIPAGLNPVAQLHQREMVLPERLADVIRGLAAGGPQARASGPQTVVLQLHPDAMRYSLNDWLQGELARLAARR